MIIQNRDGSLIEEPIPRLLYSHQHWICYAAMALHWLGTQISAINHLIISTY